MKLAILALPLILIGCVSTTSEQKPEQFILNPECINKEKIEIEVSQQKIGKDMVLVYLHYSDGTARSAIKINNIVETANKESVSLKNSSRIFLSKTCITDDGIYEYKTPSGMPQSISVRKIVDAFIPNPEYLKQ